MILNRRGERQDKSWAGSPIPLLERQNVVTRWNRFSDPVPSNEESFPLRSGKISVDSNCPIYVRWWQKWAQHHRNFNHPSHLCCWVSNKRTIMSMSMSISIYIIYVCIYICTYIYISSISISISIYLFAHTLAPIPYFSGLSPKTYLCVPALRASP